MKSIICCFLLFMVGNAFSQEKAMSAKSDGVAVEEINWMTWEEAQEANKKTKKKIFIDVYTEW